MEDEEGEVEGEGGRIEVESVRVMDGWLDGSRQGVVGGTQST